VSGPEKEIKYSLVRNTTSCQFRFSVKELTGIRYGGPLPGDNEPQRRQRPGRNSVPSYVPHSCTHGELLYGKIKKWKYIPPGLLLRLMTTAYTTRSPFLARKKKDTQLCHGSITNRLRIGSDYMF
jgi:hypothetical protein